MNTIIALYIMNTINNKEIYWNFSFASKIGLVWSYLSQNIGLFQPRKVQIQTKKRKSSLEARKIKLEG
jgi:hypothetical protein